MSRCCVASMMTMAWHGMLPLSVFSDRFAPHLSLPRPLGFSSVSLRCVALRNPTQTPASPRLACCPPAPDTDDWQVTRDFGWGDSNLSTPARARDEMRWAAAQGRSFRSVEDVCSFVTCHFCCQMVLVMEKPRMHNTLPTVCSADRWWHARDKATAYLGSGFGMHVVRNSAEM
ncbi:hypothetical protein B0T16DRAFT_403681 [Cercophora newfieldiana]|uniref:Secreted protein n=1 Tax=Cercophora newfieldiana TaxID=92897 RepID=A0AA39YG94_9PEZI|nr:hypothetical protein B0T16DRAFT_403681 [Cercophora newfieldiana]